MAQMKISLVVAAAENDIIGRRGTMLPWRLSSDLARFRELTTGHPIIMGRKTYSSIGRPLPNRHNIVVSRDPELRIEGASVVDSLEAAYELARHDGADEVFVVGGGSIYDQALPKADRIYLTRVHASPDGHVEFKFNQDEWQEVDKSQRHDADFRNDHDYTFITLERK